MATYKGKEGTITVGVSPGTALGELRSFEINTSANLVDASRMGDDWTRDESTQNSWSGSMDVFWDYEDAGQDLLTVGSRVELNLFPQGNGVGATDVVLSGQVTISEIGHKQAHDGLVERSISFKGYGALTEGVI
jgi:hypothetical protein